MTLSDFERRDVAPNISADLRKYYARTVWPKIRHDNTWEVACFRVSASPHS